MLLSKPSTLKSNIMFSTVAENTDVFCCRSRNMNDLKRDPESVYFTTMAKMACYHLPSVVLAQELNTLTCPNYVVEIKADEAAVFR